ncbi:MAG: 4Fe-4S binding protein [Planctomycetes bacterium]|nr:4Fe-4S binding protein [Planctomycetota bacterium]
MAVVVDTDDCSGCAQCVEACPCESITIVNDLAVIDADTCTDCLSCIDACPTECISEAS